MKTTIIFITAMYSVLTGLIIAVLYQYTRNRIKKHRERERDLNTQVSELTAGIDQRNEEIQRLSSSVIDQDAKIQRLIHERSDAIQAAGFAKAEIESANIRIAVLSERETMLQFELTAFADLLDRYRSQAVINIELVEAVLGVGQVQGERGQFMSYTELNQDEQEKIANAESGSVGVRTEPETDWSKVPFPEGYKVPIGVICKTIIQDQWGEFIIPKGSTVKVLGVDGLVDTCPFIEVLNGSHRSIFDKSENGYTDGCLHAHELAPLNATDHPNHPEFGK
jgi:outer membrane murein-binding lipoprotein Lpp